MCGGSYSDTASTITRNESDLILKTALKDYIGPARREIGPFERKEITRVSKFLQGDHFHVFCVCGDSKIFPRHTTYFCTINYHSLFTSLCAREEAAYA